MSVFKWLRLIAVFIDEKGEMVGSKVFGHTWGFKGYKKLTFDYLDGTYNYNSRGLRLSPYIPRMLFFDNDVFIYRLGNPDPLQYNSRGELVPIMDPEVYKVRLKNKLVVDLNRIAMGGPDFKTIMKWLLLAAVAFLVLYYFMNGGSFSSAPAASVVVSSVPSFEDSSSTIVDSRSPPDLPPRRGAL